MIMLSAALTLAILSFQGTNTEDPAPAPNLLVNGSFEDGSAGWSAGSWRIPFADVILTDAQTHGGRSSATLRIEGLADDSRIFRAVWVVPGRRYRVSGWVKTLGVAPGEPQGTVGANLGLFQRPETSESLMGDHDWTELSFEFEAGAAEEVTFAARLGFFSNIVTGQAWFDDLRLVDIGPGPAVTPSAPKVVPMPPPMIDAPPPANAFPPPPPGATIGGFDVFWFYVLCAIGAPLIVAIILAALGWSRGWKPRFLASWFFGACLVLGGAGLVTTQALIVGAVPLFLSAITLFLIPANRQSGLVLADGEAGSLAKQAEPGWVALLPLGFGVMLMVVSALFVPMVIIGLLAIVGLLGGMIAVGLALGLMPGGSRGPVSMPRAVSGVGLVVIGAVAFMVLLFSMAATLGGRHVLPADDAFWIIVVSSGVGAAVVGMIGAGLLLRGVSSRLARGACLIIVVALPVTLLIGFYLWPVLPKSL